MTKGNQETDSGDVGPEGALKPTERVFGEAKIFEGGERRERLAATDDERVRAPEQQHDDHDGGDLHDAESFVRAFVNALDVAVPKVESDDDAECGGEEGLIEVVGLIEILKGFVEEVGKVMAGGDRGNGAGEDVIDDKCADADLGHHGAECVADHNVDPATDKHPAAFQVDTAHGKAVKHYGENKPGSAFADRLFCNATDVEHGGGHVAENDRGTAPETDEGQSDRSCYNYFVRSGDWE